VLQRSLQWLRADADALAVFCAVAADPAAAAVPLRWAGALHHLALRGLQPWARLWPPAADTAPADALDGAIQGAWATRRADVQAALAKPPQTNEVQRSAALLPGLLFVSAHTGLPLSLLEIGASAGLNLWPERHRYDYGSWQWGASGAALMLRADWRGPAPEASLATRPLNIQRRAACDATPIELLQPGEALRLCSFIWPEQSERLLRLKLAQNEVGAWMAADNVAVQALPAASFVERDLAQPRPGSATVLMHSVVWQYIAAAQQARILESLAAAGERATATAPLAWLRMEPPAPDQPMELRCRLWPGGHDHLLARAHPHAAWIEWYG
jgi:hypothetical protein